jgi:type II secretory pathway component PulF
MSNKKRTKKAVKINKVDLWQAKMSFNKDFRVKFYSKLISAIHNGRNLYEVLKFLLDRYSEKNPKDPKAVAMRVFISKMDERSKLSYTLQGWVSNEEIAIIDAGEESGELVDSLELAKNIIINQKKMKATLVKSLTYPFILVNVAIGVLFFLGNYVIPQITESMGNPETWEGVARSLYDVSLFVQSKDFYIMIGGLLLMSVVIFKTMASDWFNSPVRKYFDKVPPWSIYRDMQGAAFMISLSSMIKAGIKMHDSLIRMANNSSPWTKNRIRKIIHAQKSGHPNIGDALYATKQNFPDEETIYDVIFYQSSGNLDEILEKIGQENLDRTLKNLEVTSGRINAVALMFIISLVIWIVVGVMGIQEQITSQLSM